VVFGDRTEIGRPLVFSAWSNRLMVRGEADRDDLSVYYRRSTDEPPVILDAPTSLPEFVAFLAHGRTPESPLPGLGLTYSETIGALHSMWREEAFEGGFKAEQDRILAAIMRASEGEEIEERPEFEEEPLPEEFEFLRPGGDAPAGVVPGTTRGSSAGSGLAGLAPPVEAAVPRGDTVPR
jgi:hypothetical protein